eukprot:m.126138 g.126138  ORF g.126138 m.126138 type:complete len:201 (+) comp17353_c0_seq6:95-697(+)
MHKDSSHNQMRQGIVLLSPSLKLHTFGQGIQFSQSVILNSDRNLMTVARSKLQKDPCVHVIGIKEMMGEKLAGSYGTSGGQRGTTGSIGFRSVEDAQAFINDWDGKEHNNGIIHAYFKNVVDGPEWLSYYDIDHAKALEFIDNVELKETIRDEAVDGYLEEDENQPDLEPYWGTKAIYEITMSDAKYLEHLNEGDRWCGT